jgi:PEGA domain
MPCEPGRPASRPASSCKGVEDSVSEIQAPLNAPSKAANQSSATGRHPFVPQDGSADSVMPGNAHDVLSLFPGEAETSAITQETFAPVRPADLKPGKVESAALPLRGQLHRTELAFPSVGEADTVKTELAQLREAAVQLTSEYRRIEDATRAAEERSIAAASAQSTALADLRGQLQQTELAIKQSVEVTDVFKADLAQLRESLARLTGEYRRINDATHTIEKRSAEARAIVNAIEARVQPLNILQELSRHTDARLAALNVLADQVLHKAEALEAQEAKINAILERSNSVAEIVSTMEVRIAKLKRGNQLIELTEETLGRLERVAEATSQLAQVTKMENEVASDPARPDNGHARLDERDTAGGNIDAMPGPRILIRVRLPRRRATLGPSRIRRVSKAVMSAGRGSLRWWQANVPTALDMQKARRLFWRHRITIGGLAVFGLIGLIVARSIGNLAQIGGQPAPTDAQPVLAASSLVLHEMMLRTAVPILPRTVLRTGSRRQTGNSTPQRRPVAQSLPEEPSPPRSQPPVAAQSKPTVVRSSNFIGTLEVQSDPPGAAVFINRERVGETPLQLRKLRAGSHVIGIEREGYERWTAALRVVADRVTRVDATLQPDR